jgi:hypothetical protein
MNILGLEILDKQFNSNYWQMYVNRDGFELQKELNKTYYIKDKKQRLLKVRELLHLKKPSHKNPVIIEISEYNLIFENGFEGYTKELKKNADSLFYNTWVESSNKRALEIEVYILEIYENADTIQKKSEYDAICYLIDEQFKIHKNILDEPKADVIFRAQYNCIICELILKKIREINTLEIEDIRESIQKTVKKPLTWNAQKNTIGTLFGMLHNAGIIQGSKADLIRGLVSLFSNLSETTLKDNVNLKINTNENKILYDEETETKLKDWIAYLSKPTRKSTTKQK